MIAPPPEISSSPEDIVEGEGKTRYLQSLESRLNRLQGTDKRKLKSRDILNALSESRDDHLSPSQPATIEVNSSTNDPWKVSNATDYEHDVTDSGAAGFEEAEPKERNFNLELDDFEDEAVTKTGCLLCCVKRHRYSHPRARVTGSNLTPEEESAFLLHCDHLTRT